LNAVFTWLRKPYPFNVLVIGVVSIQGKPMKVDINERNSTNTTLGDVNPLTPAG